MTDHLKNDDEWCVNGKSYRLGDFIRYNLKSALLFPGTIACEYVQQSGEPVRDDILVSWRHDQWNHQAGESWKAAKINWQVLDNIVQKRLHHINELDCALSVRIGDLIQEQQDKPRDYVKFIKDKSLNKSCDTITIVCGIHAGDDGYNTRPSAQYVKKIQNKFKRNSIKCDLQSNDPDTDFLTLVKSKHLIPDSRGFGFIAGCLNKNNVLWDFVDLDNEWWINTEHSCKNQLLNGLNYNTQC